MAARPCMISCVSLTRWYIPSLVWKKNLSGGARPSSNILPPEWAEGLRSDILNNISRDFEGDPAYDLYVSMVCNGIDPQQEKEKLARMRRLVNGTDETSITYL